jgi:hypothetical protein
MSSIWREVRGAGFGFGSLLGSLESWVVRRVLRRVLTVTRAVGVKKNWYLLGLGLRRA